jgi:hypothetical protein
VTAQGFATEKEAETISVGFHSRSDIQLRVGSGDQTVEVTSSASGFSKDDCFPHSSRYLSALYGSSVS